MYIFQKSKFILLLFYGAILPITFWCLFESSSMAEVSYGYIRGFYSFSVGIFVMQIYRLVTNKQKVIFLYVFIFMMINVIFWGGNYLLQPSFYPVWILMFAALLCCFLVIEDVGILKKLLENKYTVYLGTISYGVYLIHLIVFEGFIHAMRLVAKLQTVYETEVFYKIFFLDNKTIITGCVIGVLITTVYLSYLSYKWVEIPIKNLYYKYNNST